MQDANTIVMWQIISFPKNAQSMLECIFPSLSLASSRYFMIGEVLGEATWFTHVWSVVKARRITCIIGLRDLLHLPACPGG